MKVLNLILRLLDLNFSLKINFKNLIFFRLD